MNGGHEGDHLEILVQMEIAGCAGLNEANRLPSRHNTQFVFRSSTTPSRYSFRRRLHSAGHGLTAWFSYA